MQQLRLLAPLMTGTLDLTANLSRPRAMGLNVVDDPDDPALKLGGGNPVATDPGSSGVAADLARVTGSTDRASALSTRAARVAGGVAGPQISDASPETSSFTLPSFGSPYRDTHTAEDLQRAMDRMRSFCAKPADVSARRGLDNLVLEYLYDNPGDFSAMAFVVEYLPDLDLPGASREELAEARYHVQMAFVRDRVLPGLVEGYWDYLGQLHNRMVQHGLPSEPEEQLRVIAFPHFLGMNRRFPAAGIEGLLRLIVELGHRFGDIMPWDGPKNPATMAVVQVCWSRDDISDDVKERAVAAYNAYGIQPPVSVELLQYNPEFNPE